VDKGASSVLSATLINAGLLTAELLWINRGPAMYAVDSAAPGSLLSGPISYTGTVGGEGISAFDFHPVSGLLYGYAHTSGRLYTIGTSTGASALVGSSTTTLNRFLEMTFESASRIRIVHASGSQFTSDSTTGSILTIDTTTVEDGMVGIAHDSFTSTTYATEDSIGFLFRLGSLGGSPSLPGSGVVELVGPTTIFSSRTYNMDISSATHTAYVDDGGGGGGGTLNLYTVDLTTGTKTSLGPLALPLEINKGIAVAPVPEPNAILMITIGLAVVVRKRKRP
jgi:Domain of unknown function (DUF4394)/PEP-CTERM motif